MRMHCSNPLCRSVWLTMLCRFRFPMAGMIRWYKRHPFEPRPKLIP